METVIYITLSVLNFHFALWVVFLQHRSNDTGLQYYCLICTTVLRFLMTVHFPRTSSPDLSPRTPCHCHVRPSIYYVRQIVDFLISLESGS